MKTLLAYIVLISLKQIMSKYDHVDTSYLTCEHPTEQSKVNVQKVRSVGEDVLKSSYKIKVEFMNMMRIDYHQRAWLQNKIIPYLVTYVSQLVKPMSSGKYDLNDFEGKCLYSSLPSHLKSTDDFDLLMLVSAEDVPKVKKFAIHNTPYLDHSNRVAVGAFCGISSSNNRPVLIELAINPHRVSLYDIIKSQSFENIVLELLHQIIHAMGFSHQAFPLYKDGEKTLLAEDVIKTVSLRGKQATVVVLPQVVEAVRTHYNCPSLEGLELEDEGGFNIKDNHWERRVAEEDLMIGIIDSHQGISNFTFALLEGTGWYKRNNFEWAHRITQGRKDGCSFVKEKCVQKIDGEYKPVFDYYCDPLNSASSVSASQKQCGSCGWRNGYDLDPDTPSYFNYYEDLMTLQTPLNDNCPSNTNYKYYHCSFQDNAYQNDLNTPPYDEQYGDNSICVAGNWVMFFIDKPTYHASCIQANCVEGNKVSLSITEGYYSVLCTKKGEKVYMDTKQSLFQGWLICPDISMVCSTHNNQNYQIFQNITHYPYENFAKKEEARLNAWLELYQKSSYQQQFKIISVILIILSVIVNQ